MFVRIVKLSFNPEKIDDFLTIFEKNKDRIQNFKGCQLLELYRDKQHSHLFFTYSYWETEQDLDNYRHSDLFKTIWAQTKVYFNDKPEAWSVDKISVQ